MNIKHYKKHGTINYKHMIQLLKLFNTCEYTFDSDLENGINEQTGKSVAVVYDKLDRACGFCLLSIDGMFFLNVDVLFVDENQRKKGYATALLKYAKKFAKQIGCSEVNLVVNVQNNEARKLYEKNHYIYDKKSMARTMVTMVQFTNELNLAIGGMLYELSKMGGIKHINQNLHHIQKTKDYEKFYPYIHNNDEDKNKIIDAILDSKQFKNSKTFLNEIAKNDDDLTISRTFLYLINKRSPYPISKLKEYHESVKLENQDFKFACESVNVTTSLYKQDNFLCTEDYASNLSFKHLSIKVPFESSFSSNVPDIEDPVIEYTDHNPTDNDSNTL